jgi:kinesin family protein 11
LGYVVLLLCLRQKLLDDTKERLASTEQDLKSTKQLLAEQTTLRKAHQETEARLNFVCAELKTTLESTTSDLRGYQDKLGIRLL